MTSTIEELRIQIEKEFAEVFIRLSAREIDLNKAIEAHAYPVSVGGKRVRPLLVVLTAYSLAGLASRERALSAAISIEFMHTYSLVHDDLPAMDNDDLRRGKPTTHKVFGEANAILVGDGLQSLAFEFLTGLPQSSVGLAVSVLSRACGPAGMVGGQWLDIKNGGGASMNWSQLERLHRLKTGKLLGAAFALGYCAAVDNPIIERVARFEALGEDLGLAFQIVDDVLDVTATSQDLGKTSGKDSQCSKVTAVTLLGLKEARARARALGESASNELRDALSTYCSDQTREWQNLLLNYVSGLCERTS